MKILFNLPTIYWNDKEWEIWMKNSRNNNSENNKLMSLNQFKGPHIHSYKSVDHRSKINILSHQTNKLDIP